MSETPAWDQVDRHRLVRLCALISGSWAAAEDLAQETLLEAYRNAHKVTDADGYERWLHAIARNVCLRWMRNEAKRAARTASSAEPPDVADSFDVAVELEREELVRLLDRALSLLPAQTRQVLVHRYLDEHAPVDIARTMGVSADAVSMRISRGKLMLRRVLESELREDAEAFGFVRPADASWRSTSVWCPLCGAGRLAMSTAPSDGSMSFRCVSCFPDAPILTSHYALSNPCFAKLLGPVARPTAVMGRAADWVHDYFTAAIRSGMAPCTRCGRRTELRNYVRDEPYYATGSRRGVYVLCEACGEEATCSLSGLALALPEVRAFRKTHPRLKALPERRVESAGRSTLILGFIDESRRHHIDVLMDESTARLCGVHQTTR